MHRKPTVRAGIADGEEFDLVLRAAAHLDTPEYNLFEQAYRNWFDALDPAAIDRAFAAYMVRGVIPAWVRHYARETLTTGSLAAALRRETHRPAPARSEGLVAAGLVLASVVLVICLAVAGNPPEGCLFPPCY